MTLLTLADAQLAYGDLPLLDRAALTVLEGDRIGLIGRNGTGKSSLLRVIAGLAGLDDGELKTRDALSIALVEQEPELLPASTLRESLAQHGGLEHIPDERDRWRAEARLIEFLHRFGLDGAMDPATLSGGERKRGALALALALQPELMLLDEPTNHLDIDGITRLEELLLKAPASIVITHDRAFLDRVATKIVELDRGILRSYPGNYTAFEERRRSELASEEVANRRFDKFWAQEEVWIRKGVEARRTRNEGRVKRLESLRVERTARRDRIGDVKLTLDAGERSGRLVAELEDVGKRFGDTDAAITIVRGLTMRIMRGDRIGIMGPNGAGKTTMIRLILGALAPDTGTVRLGTGLQVAYFDQLRAQLDPEKTVVETISPGSDWVGPTGKQKHVMSYLGEFLFPPRRAQAKVASLSGGERNRLLLARLFALPANLLVLDEPTNDLDIESLELLEATLQEYTGTLLLVSHDRAFLDNVVTQTLVAEGGGKWREFVGGYSDWVAQRPASSSAGSAAAPTGRGERPSRQPQKVKLTFKEQRELASLPAAIEAFEREQHELAARMAGADYHQRGTEGIKADRQRAEEIERLLERAYERWNALEEKAKLAAAG